MLLVDLRDFSLQESPGRDFKIVRNVNEKHKPRAAQTARRTQRAPHTARGAEGGLGGDGSDLFGQGLAVLVRGKRGEAHHFEHRPVDLDATQLNRFHGAAHLTVDKD